MMHKSNLTTLCYIECDEHYLMLHRVKKKNDINQDKWIGVGGHFENGESPEECLLREVREETGLELEKYSFRGIVTFQTTDGFTEYMHLFTARVEQKEVIDCDEGELVWVKKEDVNSLNLWEGDYIFLNLLMEEKEFFSMKLVYDGEKLIQYCLNGKEQQIKGE